MPSHRPLTTAGYDIIGDIHGQAGKLRRLLEGMGYVERQGVYSHAHRQVIFVGDFIDRGPRQWETLQIARAMVEQDQALAVLGNHEFNALAWATTDPEDPTTYLRPHTSKNHRQHAAFLAEVGQDSTRYTQALDWFWSLPVYLDLPELRIIHACWHAGQLASLESSFTENQQLTDPLLVRASRPGSTDYDAIETLLKGVEAPLPDGVVIHDKDGTPRRHVRVRWWDQAATDYRAGAFIERAQREQLPNTPLPADTLLGYPDTKPLFFGHYWLSGAPRLLSPRLACLDYSAGRDGPLVAYRWQGEATLDAAHFCSSSP